MKTKINDFAELVSDIKEDLTSEQESKLFNQLSSIIEDIQSQRKSLSPAEDLELKNSFQQKILPFTKQSEFCNYCYTKPRGYAGDFAMMEMIWKGRTQPENYRYRGDSSVGKMLNAFALDSANCEANEERVHYLKEIISQYHNSTIASVGAGSVIELQELLKEKGLNNNRYHLFDSDAGAFDYIKKTYGDIPGFNYWTGNVFRTLFKKELPKFNLIYSSGFFDYLNAENAEKVAKKLWEMLEVGGTLLITNAHPSNPSRFWMEYAMEWSLCYREQKDLLKIAENLKGEHSIKVDKLGIYQYLRILKK